MIPLDLCDVLEFFPAARLEMSCDAPGVPLDESNLVMKAGRLMERELGRPMPWHVRLVKKVPHGAGLGGGSSDAACVLRTLNELERGGLSRERLAGAGRGNRFRRGVFHLWRGEPLHRARGEGGAFAGVEGLASQDCLIEAVVWCFHAGRLPTLGPVPGNCPAFPMASRM